MANKNLFRSAPVSVQATTAVNHAGGASYAYGAKHTLAQIACTNTFNGTFYVNSEETLKIAKNAVEQLRNDPEFIAKVAIYSRDKGYMKDMPAFLCVMLGTMGQPKLFRKVFDRIVNNGKMLRNVIQIGRSGQTGKKCNMTTRSWRNAFQGWFDRQNPEFLFKASIGNDPSMRDILRMCRPKANSAWKQAMFGYFLNKDVEFGALPEVVQQYENYKKTKTGTVPNVDFRFLDSLGLDEKGWLEVAKNAGWMMTRMNLNTFARHGVFKNQEVTDLIAARLGSAEEVAKAKAFPYQLLQAFQATESGEVPVKVRDALQDAMEHAVDNVPTFPGKVYVCVDVSGSMGSAITGNRGVATSKTRCVDVAALFGAAVLRKNKLAEVIPFDDGLHLNHGINARDSVMTNATKLARFGGGGTNCGLPVEHLNSKKLKADAIIFVSDNESWITSPRASWYGRSGTGLEVAFNQFRNNNPKAKLVCIDLNAAGDSSQVVQRPNVLQVGGFSDNVFDVVNSFLEQGHDQDHWVKTIENIEL